MLPSWAADTVTRIRPGSIDRRGSTEPDWTNTTETEITGCSVQPLSTSLSQDGRIQGITDGYTCYFPPGADVKTGDRIKYNGNVYTIMGEPHLWQSPTGKVNSLQAQLQRWSG